MISAWVVAPRLQLQVPRGLRNVIRDSGPLGLGNVRGLERTADLRVLGSNHVIIVASLGRAPFQGEVCAGVER